MRYFLFGDDTVSLRTFLIKLKGSYQEVETLSYKKGTTDFGQLTNKRNLFAEKVLFVVENFVPSEKDKEIFSDGDFVFWKLENGLKGPSWIDKEFSFKLASGVNPFKLADFVAYHQEKQALTTLERLVEANEPIEIIIGSLVRQFKLLSLVLEGETEKVSSSNFVKQKVLEQAKGWDEGKVKQALLKLLKTDWAFKAGLENPVNSLTILISSLCAT